MYALSAESRLPTIHGGEYEELASLVVQICRAWLALGLAPTFVFDGMEDLSLFICANLTLELFFIHVGPVLAEKIEESARRFQESFVNPSVLFYRTSPAGRSTTSFQNRISMIPSLIFPACLDALLSLKSEGVECFFADGEADPECAGLAAHYGGYVLAQDSDYLIFNAAHKGYITLDDLVWTVPSASEGLSVEDDDDGFQTVSRTKKRVPIEPAGISRGLIPPSDFLSLTVSIYHPETLAASLKIGTGLLPLIATCLGCDFTPPAFSYNFFPKTMPVAERVRRVATVIRTILYPSRSSASRHRGPRSRLLKAAQGADKVTQLIAAVVTDLAIRDDLGERELGGLVEIIRDSIFHYIVPDDFPGPGPLSDRDLVQPASEEQRKVQRRFLRAYRRGEFKLMGYYATGTGWPRPALEDPDVKTSQEVVGGPIRQWTYAVLAHGLDGVGREDVDDESVPYEDDDDELIDVVEDFTDSEDERSAYDMVTADPSMSPTSMTGSVTTNDDLSFDPLILLRNQLESLRGQQSAGVLPANGNTHLANGTSLAESSASLQSAPEPVIRPSGPRFVTEYLRRGTRLVPVKAPVQDLFRLIEVSQQNEDAKTRGDALPPIDFATPIQLHPSSTRLSLFLYSLYSNTDPVRDLPSHWILLAASLRWTIIASSTGHPSKWKGQYRGQWTKSEVKAFIASCSPSSPSLSAPQQPDEGNDHVLVSSPVTLDPASLNTRSIQLSSLILAALENIIEYAQALLLKEETLRTNTVTRSVSGKRFHWLVGRLTASRELYERGFSALEDGALDEDMAYEKESVFEAVLEGLDEHLAEEAWQRPPRAKKQKSIPQPEEKVLPKGGQAKGKVAVVGKFDILAYLQAE